MSTRLFHMSKLFKSLSLTFGCFVLLLLVACSNISKNYADKINKAYEDGNPLTLEQVRNDLDNEVEILVLNSGVIIAVKDCSSLDDIKKKVDNNEDVEGIVITIVLSKAQHAEYRKITNDDLN